MYHARMTCRLRGVPQWQSLLTPSRRNSSAAGKTCLKISQRTSWWRVWIPIRGSQTRTSPTTKMRVSRLCRLRRKKKKRRLYWTNWRTSFTVLVRTLLSRTAWLLSSAAGRQAPPHHANEDEYPLKMRTVHRALMASVWQLTFRRRILPLHPLYSSRSPHVA